jgi:hypothetical protein
MVPATIDSFPMVESPTGGTGPTNNPRINVTPWQQF